jgi:phage tail-like protein
MIRPTSAHHSFQFGVTLHVPGNGTGTELGGFSEVSGLGAEIVIAKFRSGECMDQDVGKGGQLHKPSRVTLKRGMVNKLELSEWMVQGQTHDAKAKRHLILTLRDERGQAIQRWKLQAVLPQKLTGPDLTATGNDVAIEELELSHEGIEVISEDPTDANCA